MSRVALIFGVTGQMGRYLSENLLNKKYYVIGVKRRTSADNTQRLTPLFQNPLFRIIEGDVTDVSSIHSCFRQTNAITYWLPDHLEVYNLSAQSHVMSSFSQPSLTFDVNTKGVLNLLEVLRYYPTAKFLQFSTSEMFGSNYDTKTVEGEEYRFQNEETKFAPQSPYAISKCAAHQLVRNYRLSYKLFASTIMMFNSESPLRGENFVTKKITKWVAKCYKAELDSAPYPEIELGNIKAYRDWSYAGDSMEGAVSILVHKEPDDFVIASGETYSVSDFIDMAIKVGGINHSKAWDAIKLTDTHKRPSEVEYLRGDPSKAMRLLGYRPKVNFPTLVKIMVDYDKEQVLAT